MRPQHEPQSESLGLFAFGLALMAEDEQRKPRLREVGAPEGSGERPSGLVRAATESIVTGAREALTDASEKVLTQATQALIEQVRQGKTTAWALVAAFAVACACSTAVAMWWIQRPGECNPLVVQHVMHQAEVGEEHAKRLRAAGLPEAAEAIEALTDANLQPDDVRLCVLISKKR